MSDNHNQIARRLLQGAAALLLGWVCFVLVVAVVEEDGPTRLVMDVDVDPQRSSSTETKITTTIRSQDDVSVRRSKRRGLRLTRRQLGYTDAERYHPEKDDVSCADYFANETVWNVTWPLRPPPSQFFDSQGRPGTRGAWYGGSDGTNPGSDGTIYRGYGQFGGGGGGRPLPCRMDSPSQEDDPVPPPAPVPAPAPITTTVEREDPPRTNSPSTQQPFSATASVPTKAPIAQPVPVPVPIDPSGPAPAEPDNNNQDGPVPVPIPAPLPASQPTSAGTEPYYYPAWQEESEDEILQNIVRVAVSVAAPPQFKYGAPHREVTKAVSKLLNVTSAIRSDELFEHFLSEYTGDAGQRAQLARHILEQFPKDEIPNIIPTEQALVFYRKYSPTFHRQQPEHSYFWELVYKPSDPIPIRRIPGTSTTSPTKSPTNAPTTMAPTPENINSTNPNVTLPPPDVPSPSPAPLARWFLHPVYYRCYMRDSEGTVLSITDPATLELIEEQMETWLRFHVEFAKIIADKLHGDKAVGVAMPGEEFDLYLMTDGEWVHRPPGFGPPGGSSSSSSSDSSSSDSHDDPPKPPCRPGSDEYCEDDYFEPYHATPPGTYNEPLLPSTTGTTSTTGDDDVVEDDTRTAKEEAGLIVLCSTIGATIAWTLLAMLHRKRRDAREVWGVNSNVVGTEQALQEMLSVGWKLQDESHNHGRQVLVIYDKTEHGMGYRDEDSLLIGGMTPPLFPGITD